MAITKEYLEEHYVKGMKSLRDIAAELDMTGPSVRYWLMKYNIPRRKCTDYSIPPDIVGKTFFKYTVLEYKGRDFFKHHAFLCRCECGHEMIIWGSNLVNFRRRQCAKCARKGGVNHPLREGHKDISGKMWRKIVSGAKVRELDFEITIEYISDLLESQNWTCALSGLPIHLPEDSRAHDQGEWTASLDRIDSTKGYVVGNVQWVHKHINWMKNAYPEEYFIDLCKHVAAHNN